MSLKDIGRRVIRRGRDDHLCERRKLVNVDLFTLIGTVGYLHGELADTDHGKRTGILVMRPTWRLSLLSPIQLDPRWLTTVGIRLRFRLALLCNCDLLYTVRILRIPASDWWLIRAMPSVKLDKLSGSTTTPHRIDRVISPQRAGPRHQTGRSYCTATLSTPHCEVKLRPYGSAAQVAVVKRSATSWSGMNRSKNVTLL